MKWKVKEKEFHKSPNIGDKKFEIKFAFFPVRVTGNKKVWLEKYIEVWEYYWNEYSIPEHYWELVERKEIDYDL